MPVDRLAWQEGPLLSFGVWQQPKRPRLFGFVLSGLQLSVRLCWPLQYS